MIKVCHLTSVHNAKDGRIFKKQCCSLAKAGYDVYLIAPAAHSEDINGVKIVGVPGVKKGRLYRMFFLTKAVYRKALEINADIYQIHDPELILYAAKLKKKGKIVVYDSHEDFPQQIKSKNYIPGLLRNILFYSYSYLEKKILRKMDAVISVSPNIVERLSRINPNTYQITNYPIVKEVYDPVQREDRVICFTGQISRLWMHENILSAINTLPDVRYVLAGPANEEYLEKLKKHEEWKRVDYRGEVKSEKVREILQHSKIGIALYDYSAELGYNIGTLGNTKLFEYMQAGLPIVCTDFILWKQVVKNGGCGICVNPRNINEISRAIIYLLEHQDQAREMGKKGQELVQERYNWKTQEKVLYELYRNLSKNDGLSN